MADNEQTQVNEYERTPVPKEAHKGPGKFWGMYAGEHAAGTEFMIGPLFLLAGVSLQNIVLGLLVGNLMAVLSWRYLCAPIAANARMTLYYHLEKIAGSQLVKLYNLANGVLFCFLAGAMITVSATAVGIPFDMEMPGFKDTLPNSAMFVIITLIVGLVIAVVASRGYETVAKFANVASPWMVLVFLACGIVALKQLDVSSWSDLQTFWSASTNYTTALGGKPFEQNSIQGLMDLLAENPNLVPQALETFNVANLEELSKVTAENFRGAEAESKMGFWSVMFFAWFCNAAMHVGMADLSVFRYAKKASSGWATSAGMYVGHFMAWIAAAFMLAAQIKLTNNTDPLPGPMAANVAGLAGIICVIVAGWTTANPTIYRAGLAFQAMIPGSNRTKVTFAAGLLATVSGLFPALAFKLLDFVGLYGLILAPMGAVIFFDWHFIRKRSAKKMQALEPISPINFRVLVSWLIPVAAALIAINIYGVTPHYCTLPAWLATGVLYLFLSTRQPSKL